MRHCLIRWHSFLRRSVATCSDAARKVRSRVHALLCPLSPVKLNAGLHPGLASAVGNRCGSSRVVFAGPVVEERKKKAVDHVLIQDSVGHTINCTVNAVGGC